MDTQSNTLTDGSQLPVLLVFTPSTPAHRAEVDQLLERAYDVLTPAVQIMRISEKSHPEVVRSFGFTSVPTFVLLQQGLELWRYSGPVDNPDLVAQLGDQLNHSSHAH